MKDFFKKLSQTISGFGIIFICAILGAWAGQEKKWLRRFIFPAVVTIYALYMLHNLWVLSIYTISIWLSMGYGIPDATDKGSALGRIFYKLFKENRLWANIFTRGAVGLLISLSMLSIPLLTWNWVSYFLGSVGIILVWALVSHQGFGETPLKLFGKTYQLLNVDLCCYGATTCGIVFIINGWIG